MKHVYQFLFGLLLELIGAGCLIGVAYLYREFRWFRWIFGTAVVIALLWLAYAIGEQWVK